MKSPYLAILVVCYGHAVRGLLCQECRGDPIECRDNAVTISCQDFPNDPDSDQICTSRYTWSHGIATVVKGCKARSSCHSDASQGSNDCAGRNEPDRFCQCCCEEDNCNSLMIGCAAHAECSDPPQLPNGIVQCDKPKHAGSKCNLSCLPEFVLIGQQNSNCIRNPETGKLNWDGVGQTCAPHTVCGPVPSSPRNGLYSCRNVTWKHPDGAYISTQCTVKCNVGYKLSRTSSSTSICQRNGFWSQTNPLCVPLQCRQLSINSGRQYACSNSNNLGSICEFHCNRGFRLLGSRVISCVLGRSRQLWTPQPPICQFASCRPLNAPSNGKMECTDSHFDASICIFSCDYGYDVRGSITNSVTSTCVVNDTVPLGMWTQPPPVCSRVRCYPNPTENKHLTVECTDYNNADSECTFRCEDGYDLDDTVLDAVSSTCLDDVDGDSIGVWGLYPFPTCSRIKCYPSLKIHDNGQVVCTDMNNLGSVCSFRCSSLYDLAGTTLDTVSTTCLRGNTKETSLGVWSIRPHRCAIITCPVLEHPSNGNVSCSSGNDVSSKCEFQCEPGYSLNGSQIVECRDLYRDNDQYGEWSDPTPVCQRDYCPSQDYDILTVTRHCESLDGVFGVPTGTTCSYACVEEGYFMRDTYQTSIHGQYAVKCMFSKRWDRPAPRCLPITCKRLDIPEHGSGISCTRENVYHSKCQFRCEVSYRVSNPSILMCVSDGSDGDGIGIWDNEVPTCVLID